LSEDTVESKTGTNEYKRTIDWKQGLAISMGVPLLVLPSIGYLASYLWAAAILVWGLSVCQGFVQNMAYGELATTFPEESGLPGYSQRVFDNNSKSHYSRGKFIGGFSSWGYWFAWNPTLAIFTILIGACIQGLVPDLAGINTLVFSLICGAVIFSGLTIVSARGLGNGAKLGMILAILSIVPLMILSIGPIVTGSFHIENITNSLWPTGWNWDLNGILILLGLFGIAEWSACGFEGAAIFGPQYKNPGSDVPKAIFGAGFVCLFFYVIVQASTTGVLGINGVVAEPISPFVPIAQQTFGSIGGGVLILMLVAAMTLCILTAYMVASSAMQAMAQNGYLPGVLSKLNSKGVPVRAMIVTGLFNMFLITLGTPIAILTASAFGYMFANGISLFSYYKAKSDPEMSKLPRAFKAPNGYKYVALVMGIFNVPLCLIGVAYLNASTSGWAPVIVGAFVLMIYVPIWFYSRREFAKAHSVGQKVKAAEEA
jgi:amino acid transporter